MPVSPAIIADGVDPRELLSVLARVKSGDFTARMPLEWTGVAGKVADGLNDVIIANQVLEAELARVSEVVGEQGRLSQRVVLGGSARSWSGSVQSVNNLIEALVRPTSEMQRVIGAVADGDLSKKVAAEVQGEMLELKNTINAMVDQLNGFVSELTRVAREVGTEGKLGQAAAVTIEVGGVWKDLTDNVNLMAGNLTGQVRNIAEVTTAVANGDLSKKISIDVKGEFLQLKNTVNAMVDQLNAFAGEVTRVAREVGVEGKLGGQAQSKEVAGVWKDLTDNVNQLAANLTNQVRAIAEVATAVTEGDLTRQVSMEASGEVAGLKDTLNEMIRNLRETTRQNVEQDWLKTNRERFTRMLQGQDNLATVSNMILSELATLLSAQHGVFYSMSNPTDGSEPILEFQAGYGFEERRQLATSFRLGEGLVGQCGKEKKRILLTEVPGDYVRISSGLGAAPPLNIVAIPVLFEGTLCAVIELASFSSFSVTQQTLLDSITESIGIVLSTIQASALTDTLLQQAQSLAEELRAQQGELRESNEGLERQATLLAERNREASNRNQEIEQSKRLLEEKAAQLAISSKYKSEFIANMSHELRTPLNSLLILAEQLKENPDNNMTDTQVQYASVISTSGIELMGLLNSILDLAKVESGSMEAELAEISVGSIRTGLFNEFELVAKGKGLAYSIDLAPGTPETIVTDSQRLRQILKNLLANAFKFTEHGSVQVKVSAFVPENRDTGGRAHSSSVLAIAVSDTGIGIDGEQQQRIFEAFAQGDGTTARLYGGTGLGLSISRELAGLLNGEITLTSEPGQGSTFTLYIPTNAREGTSLAPLLRAVSVVPIASAAIKPNPPEAHSNTSVEHSNGADSGLQERRRQSDEVTGEDLDGAKILIVDDDYRNIFALSALLERANAEVFTAESGAEALVTLKRVPEISIVLMDIMMPVMDGYETMRAIRALEQFKSLPMIAVTGKVMAGERQRCIDAGANDYASKPIDTSELLTAVKQWVPKASRRTTVAAATVPLVDECLAPDRNSSLPSSQLERNDPQPAENASSGKTHGGGVPSTILVVDDEFRNTFAMSALIERGHVVLVADSGAQAIVELENSPDIDVVLMDIMMPVMDGYETMRAIRAVDRFNAIPIIAVTGKVMPGERERCIDAGANDYVPKPVDSAELRGPPAVAPDDSAVDGGMTTAMRFAEPRNTDTRGSPTTPGVPVLLVDDNAAKRLALVSVLSPFGYSIVEADSGVAALRCLMVQDFAVILLDVRMPIMDGIETAAMIRQRRQSEMTPIIFITAHAGDEGMDIDRYAAGAVDFIFAPVAPEELRAKVSVFANLFSKAESLATQAREVQASADQLRRLTDAAPIGIFETDAENRYVYTNPRWSEITGRSADDALGRKFDTFTDPDHRSDLGPDLATDDGAQSEFSRRYEVCLPGTAPRTVLVISRPIPDIDGGNAGWVGTLADVTAEAGAETALSEARDEATEASRLKSDFLANMSHEIRTPMNGVIGMTDLLLDTELDDRQRDYAQTVRNSGEALLAIISDILDFSKIEAGKLEVEHIEFDLRTVVDNVTDLLAGAAQAKDLELMAVIGNSVPTSLMGDPGRVRQVLTNLVANAIKFTPSGEIVVRVAEVDTPHSDETIIRFEVTDTGVGIAPEKLEMIFQPFVQADSSTSRRYGGTGLGLAISGQLVALMGGDCGVSSRLGEGSSFWFTIGVHVDSERMARGAPALDASLSGISVLIVDDNATQRSVLSDYLTDWGMAVGTAADGATALTMLQDAVADEQRFAIVLVDRFMPGMDGMELKSHISAAPCLAAGVVLMTGVGQDRDVGEVAEGVVCSMVSKPIRRDDLRACLRVVLGLDEAPVARSDPSTPRPAPEVKTGLGHLLLAEDNLINQKVAVAILTTAGYSVDTVINGAEAVRAVAAHDYDAILMDCQMPELSGYEATAEIRSRGGTRGRTPIIAMTAGARREDQERCLAEGMDSYLSKPVSKDALLALVDRSVRTEQR